MVKKRRIFYCVESERTDEMALPGLVRQWLSMDESVIRECRHCGTSLDTTEQPCPTCGSTETVDFDVS